MVYNLVILLSPFFSFNIFTCPFTVRATLQGCWAERVRAVTLLSFHSMLTAMPPRARIPLTEPFFQFSGKAGSNSIEH